MSTAIKTRRAIGHAIRAGRLKASITQAQLAKRSGLSQTHISRMEAGDKAPSLGVLRTLARILGLDTGALLSHPN
jgi:transcriptional regulator with XRE-family HTH domain